MTLLVKKSLWGVHFIPIRLKVCPILMEMFVARIWNSFLIYWLRSLPQNEWFSGETGKYTCNLGRKLDWCSFGQIRDRSERLSDALVNVCSSECLCFPLLQQRYVVVALNRASFHKAAALRYDISRWEDNFSSLIILISFLFVCLHLWGHQMPQITSHEIVNVFADHNVLTMSILDAIILLLCTHGESLFIH